MLNNAPPGSVNVNITSQVLETVRRDLFGPTTHVWADEVSVPGGDSVRRLDGCAINVRVDPFHIEGLEVKVSRGDWLNDKDGAKSKPARDAVDRFWFVFGSPDIFREEEVVPGAGIITIRDGRAVVVREPAQAPHSTTYPRALVSSILTRTLRADTMAFVRNVERKAEAKGYQKGLAAAKRAGATTKRPSTRAPERMKYNPGRYNFDDGVPLDLP